MTNPKPKTILILGANSAIAIATAKLWASQGHHLFLVGRDPAKLQALTQDLKVRYHEHIFSEAQDLTESKAHQGLLTRARASLRSLDLVFIVHGVLGDQLAAEKTWDETFKLLDANFLSQASLLTHIANEFEQSQHGHIAVITSVAGDRGRATNYIYGTAKGALSIFLSGLRNRLASKNIPVTDFKLGFVDTPMTVNYKKGLLWATPDAIAKSIASAIDCKKDVVYLPWFWCWIMLVIRNIPERLFKKMRI